MSLDKQVVSIEEAEMAHYLLNTLTRAGKAMTFPFHTNNYNHAGQWITTIDYNFRFYFTENGDKEGSPRVTVTLIHPKTKERLVIYSVVPVSAGQTYPEFFIAKTGPWDKRLRDILQEAREIYTTVEAKEARVKAELKQVASAEEKRLVALFEHLFETGVLEP